MQRSPWTTYEKWKNEGISKGYDKKNVTYFQKEAGKKERSWYAKARSRLDAIRWKVGEAFRASGLYTCRFAVYAKSVSGDGMVRIN